MPVETRHHIEFSFSEQIEKLRRMQAERPGEKVTLAVIGFPLLIMLASVPKDVQWGAHRSPGRVVVQVLEGKLQMTVEGEQVVLSAGGVCAFESDIVHDLLGLEDTIVLITLARSN